MEKVARTKAKQKEVSILPHRHAMFVAKLATLRKIAGTTKEAPDLARAKTKVLVKAKARAKTKLPRRPDLATSATKSGT